MKKYHDIEHLRPLEVEVDEMGFDVAMKLFRMKVQKEKIIPEVRQRMHYEKPSVAKRRKSQEARNREALALLRERQMASGEWQEIQERQRARKTAKAQENSKE